MAVKTLTYVLLGQDRLSPVAERAGATVEGSFSKMGRAMELVGAAMAATGVVVAVESARAASAFQASMEKIHTQAGGSQKDVQSLTQAVLKLAPSTQQGPEALSEALYHLKSVGMDNAAAMRALGTASNLAAVGGSDLESTTNALAGAWRSGIKGAQSFSGAAATVNAIIGAGNMKMQDFTDAIGTGILPSAKTFGLSLRSVGAALALMTDEGVPAVDAATRLRMSFSLLGAPSNVAEKQLSRIGITGLQLANAMRGPQGIVGAITLLKTHLDQSGMSASEQAQLLSKAFGGGRSSSAILTMVNNLEVLRKKQDQINATTGRYGAAVAAQRQTASAQFAILRSTLETIGIRIGSALLPPITRFVQLINSGLGPNVTRVFRSISGAVGIVASGISRAFGPTVVALFHNLVSFGGELFDSFRNLASAVAPLARLFGVMVGAVVIAALRTLGFLLANVIGPALKAVTGFVRSNKTVFDALAVAVLAVTAVLYIQRTAMAVWIIVSNGVKTALIAVRLAQWALNAAFLANPIGIVIAALIALAAALAYAWTHSATFRKFIISDWNAMKTDIVGFINWWRGPFVNFFVGVYEYILGAAKAFRTGLDREFSAVGNFIRTMWNALWAFTVSRFVTDINSVISRARSFYDFLRSIFNSVRSTISSIWSNTWSTVYNTVRNGVNNAVRLVQGIPGAVRRVFNGARTWLVQAGKDVLNGLWDGFTAVWKKLTGWITGLAGWIKAHKGPISLDRKLLEPAGRALMEGLGAGLVGGFGTIGSFITGIGSKIGGFFASLFKGGGSGVTRWTADVEQALKMLGLPVSLTAQVLRQIQTESGGNPNAINNWDVNAQHGDPSRGLLQTIGSTFAAYHVKGTSFNIYDPLANIAAAINYARHVYGPSLMRGGMGLGSGHGYASGTSNATTGWHWVGEKGRELMYFRGGESVIPNSSISSGIGGSTFIVNVYVSGHALASKQEIGREVSNALKAFQGKGGKV